MLKQAKWIWADVPECVNQYVDFLKEFSLDEVDRNATLEISVDGEYAVYLNGEFVNCGQYHDYPAHKSYDSLSIGKFLQKGENRLEITANRQGNITMQYAIGECGLAFGFNNFSEIYVSDTSVLCRLNTNYASEDAHMITAQVGYGFCYRAGENPLPWEQAVEKAVHTKLQPRPILKNEILPEIPTDVIAQGYFIRTQKDSDSPAHRLYTDFLSHRKFEDIFEGEASLPGSIKLRSMEFDGVYLLVDLEREESGFFTMDLELDQGAVVEIGFGEHLKDLRVRTEIKQRQFANHYVAHGGREQFTHYFKRIAGRYLEIHISNTASLTIHYFGLKPCYYPITPKGYFNCNDTLHNKIYEVSLNTLRQCMHEHFEDCPWREQALYASDSRNQALCGYYVYEDSDFIRASLALLGDSFGEDGYQSICAPTDETLRIPTFTLLWFLEMKEYLEFTGDITLAQQYWDKMTKAIAIYHKNGFHPLTEDCHWNFYEWSPGYENWGQNALRKEKTDYYDGIYQVFVCIALKSMVYLAEKLGKTEISQEYQGYFNDLKNNINKMVWNNEAGMYSSYYYDGKQQHYGELMQVMALYTGVAEGKEDILCKLLTNPENDLVKITLSYSLYKYESLLMQGGKYDRFVFSQIGEKWGKMLYQGATSFWETELGEADFQLAGSLCHGWSAHPVYLYFRYILGITPGMLNGKAETFRESDVFAVYEGKCATIEVVKKEGGTREIIQ